METVMWVLLGAGVGAWLVLLGSASVREEPRLMLMLMTAGLIIAGAGMLIAILKG